MKSYDYSRSNYVLISSKELDTFIEDTQARQRQFSLRRSFERIWNLLLSAFAESSEPKIYQKHDRDGNVYFKVYDPVTHQTEILTTEQEVRVWLDQRYYQ
ncbi:hypothetical protein [Thermocoleostomius sinensis]|uniref:Uncharacterized protein n=1 Tax=Thermocoleostomius sinensis A174 TaxID=2016057 RepID=A0A9E8ZE66_9CYAN|nr:hypothetical protein [Thermocoleostomius sinensis]WAL61704.1 hypothetical protein OXH18_06890 [Thermocoleostomius sinensis A174]